MAEAPYGKSLSAPGLLARLISPYDRGDVDDNPNALLARAIYEAIYREWLDNMDSFRLQTRDATATGGFLDKFGNFWLVPRRVDESDEAYRLRIWQRKARKWGATNMDELLILASTLLNTDSGSIQFIENVYATGEYAPARIRFGISSTLFLSAGFPTVESGRATIEELLDEAAPAGVVIQVQLLGGAIWDDVDSMWDNADSRWGDEAGGFTPTTPTTPTTPPPGGIGSSPIGGESIGE